MIYFDNAATTKEKPKCVLDAFCEYVSEIGVSPGRGSYSIGVEASRMLYRSRMTVAAFFGLNDPNVVFTKNSTEAINMLFRGCLNSGDHIIISPYEHNAVVRPLERMREEGIIEYSVISREDLSMNSKELLEKYVKDNTRLLALTLASNLTGRIIFRKELLTNAKMMGISTFVDSSQGAGKIRINMLEDSIDYLAFTGHKDLKGLPGIGGLCSTSKLSFSPLIQGGTGILGHERVNPRVYPEGYESGTLNMPAIWSLKTAIEYVQENFEKNKTIEIRLIEYLVKRLKELKNVVVYDSEFERIDTVGFNVDGYSSNEIVGILDKKGICVRGGIHCAIVAHEALQTTETGVVRVSLSESNTVDEIDRLIEEIKGLVK